MQKALRHTVIIDFSHCVKRKLLFRWFKSGVFQPHFGAYSRCDRRYPYIKGRNSGASQKILWEQVVTCSAHSKEHFKTNLAEYWRRGGCTVGQVTSRTTSIRVLPQSKPGRSEEDFFSAFLEHTESHCLKKKAWRRRGFAWKFALCLVLFDWKAFCLTFCVFLIFMKCFSHILGPHVWVRWEVMYKKACWHIQIRSSSIRMRP